MYRLHGKCPLFANNCLVQHQHVRTIHCKLLFPTLPTITCVPIHSIDKSCPSIKSYVYHHNVPVGVGMYQIGLAFAACVLPSTAPKSLIGPGTSVQRPYTGFFCKHSKRLMPLLPLQPSFYHFFFLVSSFYWVFGNWGSCRLALQPNCRFIVGS